MKKLSIRNVSIALATVVAGSALSVSMASTVQAKEPTANNTGTWRSQNVSTFKIPANWTCGPTGSTAAGNLYSQTCIIRSGNYVQGAQIVTNTSYALRPTQAQVQLYDSKTRQFFGGWQCPPSAVGARGMSICFGATLANKPRAIYASGTWRDGPRLDYAQQAIERPR